MDGASTEPNTVDLTLTWTAVLPIMIAALESGTEKGKSSARAELRRMAALADAYVEYSKACPISE